jgi:hypothetical protein
MRSRFARPLAFVLLTSAAAVIGACASPETDIVATYSGDTGPWDVSDAHADGAMLKANVCMSRASAADEVSDRLLLQLRSKGYERIELSMFAPAGDGQTSQRLVSWTPTQGKQLQPPSTAGQDPCAARNEANEPATDRSSQRAGEPDRPNRNKN